MNALARFILHDLAPLIFDLLLMIVSAAIGAAAYAASLEVYLFLLGV